MKRFWLLAGIGYAFSLLVLWWLPHLLVRFL
jgi:hypothetical protein